MLQLAHNACPENRDIRGLWSEFDIVNASLQEQFFRDGDTQIAWNKEMSARLLDRGEALLPIIHTFRDVAVFSLDRGRRQLAPIFADRAAMLAESEGGPLSRRGSRLKREPLGIMLLRVVAPQHSDALIGLLPKHEPFLIHST